MPGTEPLVHDTPLNPTSRHDDGLQRTVEAMAERLGAIEERMATIEALACEPGSSPDASDLRRPPREEAEREIIAYWSEHDPEFASDIAFALGIDPRLVHDIRAQLTREGRAPRRNES